MNLNLRIKGFLNNRHGNMYKNGRDWLEEKKNTFEKR